MQLQKHGCPVGRVRSEDGRQQGAGEHLAERCRKHGVRGSAVPSDVGGHDEGLGVRSQPLLIGAHRAHRANEKRDGGPRGRGSTFAGGDLEGRQRYRGYESDRRVAGCGCSDPRLPTRLLGGERRKGRRGSPVRGANVQVHRVPKLQTGDRLMEGRHGVVDGAGESEPGVRKLCEHAAPARRVKAHRERAQRARSCQISGYGGDLAANAESEEHAVKGRRDLGGQAGRGNDRLPVHERGGRQDERLPGVEVHGVFTKERIAGGKRRNHRENRRIVGGHSARRSGRRESTE